jgi:hypothetical protein
MARHVLAFAPWRMLAARVSSVLGPDRHKTANMVVRDDREETATPQPIKGVQ